MSAPAKIVVLATIVVPGDEAAPLNEIEAYLAHALSAGGFLVTRLDAEFVDARDALAAGEGTE